MYKHNCHICHEEVDILDRAVEINYIGGVIPFKIFCKNCFRKYFNNKYMIKTLKQGLYNCSKCGSFIKIGEMKIMVYFYSLKEIDRFDCCFCADCFKSIFGNKLLT